LVYGKKYLILPPTKKEKTIMVLGKKKRPARALFRKKVTSNEKRSSSRSAPKGNEVDREKMLV